jgi:hypothetical protein
MPVKEMSDEDAREIFGSGVIIFGKKSSKFAIDNLNDVYLIEQHLAENAEFALLNLVNQTIKGKENG